MATSTITGTITDAAGTALSGVVVKVRLVPKGGFRTADGSEVAPEVRTTTNASGVWSLALERNSGISPANTHYEVEELVPVVQGGPRIYQFQVGASNQTLFAALVSPVTDATYSNYLTQAAADARYVLSPGSFSGTVSESRPGDATTAGVATSYSRGDHKHDREQISGTNAARLALSGTDLFAGLWFYATDTKRLWLYTGSAWQYISGNPPRARASRSAVQTIPTSTDTAIALTSETNGHDTDAIHDTVTNNSRMTIPTGFGGLWGFSYSVSWAVAGVATARGAYVNKNGANPQYARSAGVANTAVEPILVGSGAIPCAAGDYLQLAVFQFSGGNQNCFTLFEMFDYFQVYFISPEW